MGAPTVLRVLAAATLCAGAFAGVQVTRGARDVAFVREIPWEASGVWLRADLHAHTKFSDGGHTVLELLEKAAEHGCDVAAVTDHADGGLKAATPEYHAAIAAARERVPQLVVLAGMEWNIPPGKGTDHVTTLWPTSMEDQATFAEFKARFDDDNKEGENPELADEALAWMKTRAGGGDAPVLFLNHPSRKVAESADLLPWLRRWRGLSRAFAGVEGAPGHQHASPLGAYGGAVKPLDRWDPVVAEVGGVWDQLLAEGLDLWGSSATSDFHSWDNGDYWPCQFSETWIYARERTSTAVLEALRAGSFFGAHGRVVTAVSLSVSADGLKRGASPGEVIRVAPGRELTVTLSAQVPKTDWEGAPNRLDRLEIITVDAAGARVAAAATEAPATLLTATVKVPEQGVVVRARGCRLVADGPALCFYTNPVRVTTGRPRPASE